MCECLSPLAAIAYRTRLADAWNFKYYRYGARGRVTKMWNIIKGFDTLITEYQYNSQDQTTMYSHYGSGSPRTFRNSYDYAGRLSKVEFYAGAPDAPNPEYITLAEYLYNENSQVSQQLLNDGGVKTNYYYNNRQWVTEIQESGGLFDFINDYYKNGNVKSQQLSGSYKENFDNTTDLNLTYTYDKSNRLLETENANQQYKDHFKLENAYDKDGNILELKRYDGAGSVMDNFNYTYYSNTNKLQRVTGSGTQYTYDANGNMTSDKINRNRDIKYDHRNLILQIAHTEYVLEDSLLYATYYYYNEAGNRVRKRVYQYIGLQIRDSVEIPDIEEAGDSPGIWELINDEIYSRGADGKELAIYVNWNLKQTNIWGLGHEGYITTSDDPNFYLKDHLGSIRVVTNENDEVISAQDYDAWGYLMEGRTYESVESVYKFTGKERDVESEYDYFGARYYDARLGRWGSMDPLMEKHYDFSPYNYVLNNPLKLIDPDGKDVIIEGENRREVFEYLKSEFKSLKLRMDKAGKISYKGVAKTKEELVLLNAIDNPDVFVNLLSTLENNIGQDYFAVGMYGGSTIDNNGVAQVTQYFNVDHSKVWREAGGGSIGRSIMHEIIEGYIGGFFYPGTDHKQSYELAHSKTVSLEDPARFYPEKKTGVTYDPFNRVNIFNRKYLIDAKGVEHLLYTKDDIR